MKATSMNLEQRSMKPLMMYFAALTATAANAADIRFTLDKPGNVSLGICDAKGRMIRTLLRAKPLPAGRHTVDWDGLDRDGTPMAGDFQWRLAASQGLESEYLLSIGTSMREHHWPAQHDALCAVAVDDQRIYVTAGLSEGMPQTAAMTRDGGWQWVSVPTGGWMGGYDLAVDGETLYFLGGPVTGTPECGFSCRRQRPVRMRDGLKNQTIWGTQGPMCWPVEPSDRPRRVDARDGELVVASPSTGLIVWLDPATGKEIDRLRIEGGLADVALARRRPGARHLGQRASSKRRVERPNEPFASPISSRRTASRSIASRAISLSPRRMRASRSSGSRPRGSCSRHSAARADAEPVATSPRISGTCRTSPAMARVDSLVTEAACTAPHGALLRLGHSSSTNGMGGRSFIRTSRRSPTMPTGCGCTRPAG